jgi:lipopolysaccharide transport system permease protein
MREMWQYRHLFLALVWRNIRIEFDAMRLGSFWAISRPILFAVVFGFFRHLSGANTYVEVPYVPYVYTGLLLWTYFTDVATNVASATRGDSALLSKIYYPRLLTPLVPVVSGLVILAVGMLPLAVLMVIYKLHPGWMLLLLPVVVLPCIAFALGLGLLVSALSIEDRDWERALVFSLTIGLWLSPVIYAPDMIPSGVRQIYHLNPMAGPLLAFRAVLFEGVPFPTSEFVYSVFSSAAVLALGTFVFRRTELRLVDRL